MKTSDFDYHLPHDRIAQHPAEPRGSSRLMVLHRAAATIDHHVFRDLPSLLQPGDVLVRNDTRVMAARLHGVRSDTGGHVEALLVRELEPLTWQVMMRPARQAAPGHRFTFEAADGPLEAEAAGRDDDLVRLRFERPFDPASVGAVPLPPYIDDFHGSPESYQTVYARDARSAAAPTAGLHFTPALIDELEARNISFVDITLEVGPGTFQPVKVDDPRDHRLHEEHVALPAPAAAALERARAEGRRIIAVGTTVVRTLEHVARERGRLEPYEGWTGLKILPGDSFLAIDGLITNFHLPRSTLLMLVCAFAGTGLTLNAYRQAVDQGYRFYSFGDAMLILA
jgi:S-adenosylmethionine:tRNA ribosyltransferase-isomerase